jgi:hexosaminidase
MFLKTWFLLALLSAVHAIWPAPQKLTTGDKVLFIDQTLAVTYNGGHVRWSSSPPDASSYDPIRDTEIDFHEQLPYTYGYLPTEGSSFNSKDIVQSAISRTFNAIFRENFVPWKLRPRNSDFEPDVYTAKTYLRALEITQTHPDTHNTFKPKPGDVDESYTLRLSDDGTVKIIAKSSTGIIRALESFVQLFYQHSTGTFWYTTLAPVYIEDAPKFSHRGVMLDVARCFLDVKDVKRTIDAMSWNKLNKLHIHATDSQSWPLDIPALPELAAKGAYRKGLSYSPKDLAEIQQYAVYRGVQVIVEIDMPGHIGSVSHAYPELIVAYNEQPYHWWCLEPPCGALKLNSPAVDRFLDTLFEDLLPRLRGYSSYFHMGGDELNRNDSMLDEGVRSNDTEVLQPLLQRFIDKTHARIRKGGLIPIVWEEILLDWEIKLGKDVVIHSWLGGDSLQRLTEAGHQVIDSNYHYWVSWFTFQTFDDVCGTFQS